MQFANHLIITWLSSMFLSMFPSMTLAILFYKGSFASWPLGELPSNISDPETITGKSFGRTWCQKVCLVPAGQSANLGSWKQTSSLNHHCTKWQVMLGGERTVNNKGSFLSIALFCFCCTLKLAKNLHHHLPLELLLLPQALSGVLAGGLATSTPAAGGKNRLGRHMCRLLNGPYKRLSWDRL